MTHFLLSIFLLFFQAEKVEFELVNTSSAPIIVEIPGFRSMTLIQDQVSPVRFRTGQELYAIDDLDSDHQPDRIHFMTVAPEHAGQVIRVDKELKRARKELLKNLH